MLSARRRRLDPAGPGAFGTDRTCGAAHRGDRTADRTIDGGGGGRATHAAVSTAREPLSADESRTRFRAAAPPARAVRVHGAVVSVRPRGRAARAHAGGRERE